MNVFPPLELWLWVSIFASAAGWVLSVSGQLNRDGYLVCFAIFGVFLWMLKRAGRLQGWAGFNGAKFLSRFRRALPLAFAGFAALILLSGILYPPTNHTALSYRTPRVLHWLAAEQWHWIHTPNYRMNDRACGIEWLSAPFLLFTKSDRALFLLNFIPFLLLPGLIFSLCTRLGVRARVAWTWMWLLPTGYTFLLQAGSTGNDTFPAVYALAALDFGCRAWVTRRPRELFYSILCAALLTGAKASNLPLLLPWSVLIVALLPLLRGHKVATGLTLLLAALVSFVPSALLNVKYCGDWSGLSLEHQGMAMKNPLVGIWGNGALIVLNNFVPPFFPLAGWWNQHALDLLPQLFRAPLMAHFEEGFLYLGELPTEDWCGLGLGVSFLVAVSAGAAWRLRRSVTPLLPATRQPIPEWVRRCALAAPWLALIAYCSKTGMVTAARLVSPYYPLLLPLLLTAAGQREVVRRRWWRGMVCISLLLSLVVVVVTPARPLWPAQTILSKALAAHPDQRVLQRAHKVYSVYADRWDPLAGVRSLLPQDLKTVGFVGTSDDIDISLWRPLGARRVEHILLGESATQIRKRGIGCAVVSGLNLKENNVVFEDWLNQTRACLLVTTNAVVKVADGPQAWHIVTFKD